MAASQSLNTGVSPLINEDEILADRYSASGNVTEARRVFEKILENKELPSLARARIHKKIGNTYTSQWDFEASLVHYQNASEQLQQIIGSPGWFTEWINLQIDYSYALHSTHHFDQLDKLVLQLKPVIAEHGTDRQKINYLKIIYYRLLKKHRWFMLPEESLTHCQAIILLADKEQDPETKAWGTTMLGFCHLWRHEPKPAKLYCGKALQLLQHLKYDEMTAGAYSGMAYAYRKERNIQQASMWAEKALAHAQQNNNLAYEMTSLAVKSWVLLKREDVDAAETAARKVYEFFKQFRHPFLPFCLPVLISIALQKNNIEQAAQYAFVLLHPEGQQLPDEITRYLKEGVALWGEKNITAAGAVLQKAITVADETGFL